MAGNILDELVGPQLPPEEDDKYNISAQIMKKFGQNFSPEQRLKLQEEANRRKLGQAVPDAIAQWAAGMRGKPGDADESIQRKMLAIDDETTGDFDRRKEQAVRDYVMGQNMEKFGQQQTVFDQAQEDRAEGRDPTSPMADDARNMINWVGTKLGMDPAKLEGMGIEQLKQHPNYDQAVNLYTKEKIANRPTGMGGFGPDDQPFMVNLFDIARGVKPPDTPVDTSKVSPKALAAGATAGGAARGRANAQNRWSTLRGKPLQDFTAMAQVLTSLDSIAEKLPGWDTGFLKNKANRLAWYAGMDDPKRAQINTTLGLQLAEYIKSVSGTAVNPDERAFLTSITPNADTDEDSLYNNMAAFQEYIQEKMNTALEADKVGGYNVAPAQNMAQDRGWFPPVPQSGPPPAGAAQPQAKKLINKQYSASRNKTKLIYEDGSEEVVDGRQ